MSFTMPVAEAFANPPFAVVGSVVRLDGRRSLGDGLTYTWRFAGPLPIGSRIAAEGFKNLEADGSVVTFAPDVVGEYSIGLTVSDGVADSEEHIIKVPVRAILVPHGKGIVPDGKFIWQYLRDAWADVEGKEMFETLWSVITQTVGGELLKLYQVDFNKSIRDIQPLFQRRWLNYDARLNLDAYDVSFVLGYQGAGTGAMTGPSGLDGKAIVVATNEIVLVEGSLLPSPAGVGIEFSGSLGVNNLTTSILRQNARKTGYVVDASLTMDDRMAASIVFAFSANSKSWTYTPAGEDIQVGDVIYVASGVNAGVYGITAVGSGVVTVDKAPLKASDGSGAAVHRPISVDVSPEVAEFTRTIAIPVNESPLFTDNMAGRLLVVSGRSYTILRVGTDGSRSTPRNVITLDQEVAPSSLSNLNWRLPHTLISKSLNFESLGIFAGDVITFDVEVPEEDKIAQVRAQVVGVDRNRIGFVLTDEPTVAGEVPAIPDSLIESLKGALSLDDWDTALEEVESESFGWTYFNKELTHETDFVVGARKFRVRPRTILRNRFIPISDQIRSIPSLQQFIVQPEVVQEDGAVYQVKDGERYPLERLPVTLFENSDYVVDGETAFRGKLTFELGSSVVQTSGGDFVDRSILPGDKFELLYPAALRKTYTILKVVDSDTLILNEALPSYLVDPLTAEVRITRARGGHFIRLLPGMFGPKNVLCDRLWAEVTFFDNGENIENNFGLSVGLSRDSLEDATNTAVYRQAVAGLMYAYAKGSSINKVRLGVQILLGLPFSEHRGVVRSIELDYRTDQDGNPILGRMLVEDVDAGGAPQSIFRIYTFPLDPESNMSGIDVNPATSKPYEVGDTVEIFASLSKGVEVLDSVLSPLGSSSTAKKRLQQFHSIRVRFNDKLFNDSEVRLVSEFLSKITPHYISWFLVAMAEARETVEVGDVLGERLVGTFYDNPSLTIPTTLMLGSKGPLYGLPVIFVEDGLFTVRRVGFDMEMTGVNSAVVAGGGLVDPGPGEAFDPPLCVDSDKLYVLSGLNKGLYDVNVLLDDQLEVAATGYDFALESGVAYAILRPVKARILNSTATCSSGDYSVTLTGTGALRTYGVAPGHWLLLRGRRFLIQAVRMQSTSYNQVVVTPTPDFSGTFAAQIYNPKLLTSPFSDSFTGQVLAGVGTQVITVPYEHKALLDVGDEFELHEETGRPKVRVLNPNYSTTEVLIDRVLSAASYPFKIHKAKRPSGIGLDLLAMKAPEDEVAVCVRDASGETATCTAGSAEVVLGGGTNPGDLKPTLGDLLQLTSGANSTVDVGLGLGVFPILYADSTKIYTAQAMTQNGTASWKILRRG